MLRQGLPRSLGESISIVDCVRQERYSFDGASIGIVSPTYDLGLPSIVKEFLERVSLDTAYFYFISTYGTTTGASGRMANKALRGRKIDAYYSVRMPDTWTPIFDLSTPEKVAAFTKNDRGRNSRSHRQGATAGDKRANVPGYSDVDRGTVWTASL